jgi:hypothetical protein
MQVMTAAPMNWRSLAEYQRLGSILATTTREINDKIRMKVVWDIA